MLLLLWFIGLPLLAGSVLVAVPRQYRFLVRLIALAATFATLVIAAFIFWKCLPEQAGFRFIGSIPWVSALGISLALGVDGLNAPLVLMAAVVAFAATAVSWEIKEREKEFYILLLWMIGGIFGAFVSLDLFFLYAFHELALVPTFIMIGVWGRGPDKAYAAFQITIYLTLGALIALLGLIWLYVESGAQSFLLSDIARQLQAQPIATASQESIFALLLFGFGILVSLWPFHTWAPLGYASAPTGTAMLHAGVLKKFGLYALIRVALPLLPEGAARWMPILACLCLGNILYNGWVAMRQRNLNYLIGNSSVAHMGFAFLGIASLTVTGVTGAVLVMVAHGFLAALSFGLSGYLYHQRQSLEMDQFQGLLRQLPFVGTAFIMALFAGCGLPGFAPFAGESLVFFGAWKAYPSITAAACWGGLIIGAVYALRAVRSIFHGPLPAEQPVFADAIGWWRRMPYVLLLAMLLLFGLFPGALADRIKTPVQALLKQTP